MTIEEELEVYKVACQMHKEFISSNIALWCLWKSVVNKTIQELQKMGSENKKDNQ